MDRTSCESLSSGITVKLHSKQTDLCSVQTTSRLQNLREDSDDGTDNKSPEQQKAAEEDQNKGCKEKEPDQ